MLPKRTLEITQTGGPRFADTPLKANCLCMLLCKHTHAYRVFPTHQQFVDFIVAEVEVLIFAVDIMVKRELAAHPQLQLVDFEPVDSLRQICLELEEFLTLFVHTSQLRACDRTQFPVD